MNNSVIFYDMHDMRTINKHTLQKTEEGFYVVAGTKYIELSLCEYYNEGYMCMVDELFFDYSFDILWKTANNTRKDEVRIAALTLISLKYEVDLLAILRNNDVSKLASPVRQCLAHIARSNMQCYYTDEGLETLIREGQICVGIWEEIYLLCKTV